MEEKIDFITAVEDIQKTVEIYAENPREKYLMISSALTALHSVALNVYDFKTASVLRKLCVQAWQEYYETFRTKPPTSL